MHYDTGLYSPDALDALHLARWNGHHTLRQLAEFLSDYQRVEFLRDDGLNFVMPPGFIHGRIVSEITTEFSLASLTGRTPRRWCVHANNFPFEWDDPPRRFCVPDLAIGYPDVFSDAAFQKKILMVAEITSPQSPEMVENDYGIKYRQYARCRVPLYLLVDQALATWHLYFLRGRWPGYQVYAEGAYGEPIELPEPFGFNLPTDAWPYYQRD